jgi:hypothetical protein
MRKFYAGSYLAPGARLRLVELAILALLFGTLASPAATAGEPKGAIEYHKAIEPILSQFCFDCHSTESSRGRVTFDHFKTDAELLENRELWWKALKMLRAGLMPPRNKARPDAEQVREIENWIKTAVFKIDPKDPDPGHVTVRRLNRVEYRNTIRDLMGISFDTDAEFPPDDTGHGFDNIGEVLSLSQLLLEKYIAAARTIVARAVPTTSAVVAETRIPGGRFHAGDDKGRDGNLVLSYYKPALVSALHKVEHSGRYQVVLDMTANERYVDGMSDYNKCRLLFKINGHILHDHEYSRQGGKPLHFEFDQDWNAGPQELTIEVTPLTPAEKQVRSLTVQIGSVTIRGPLEKKYWVRPRNYARYFSKPVPEGAAERRAYAQDLLRRFATRAFRRPVDEGTALRLAKLAEHVYERPGQTFESGIAEALTVVLASPRFLFREESEATDTKATHPFIDEYALASRLSYFLWSSMPDEELMRLAGNNDLRKNLASQLTRMLADPRSAEFVRQFTGQWLQARDIDSVEINAFAVITRDEKPDPEAQRRRARFRELSRKPGTTLTDAEKKELAEARTAFFASFRRFSQFALNGDLRRAMRRETEMVFEHVLHDDRPLLELIDSDYTFLNERLARHYKIEGVTGDQMRRVSLPANSPRGGVLTQATVLAITSNPDRTSPVKRGLFILDNILGTPPPPPPPNIPPLEDTAAKAGGQVQTLRETLKIHRASALCSSCHNRMDPLGLALENFNALGIWRETERGKPVDAAGQLVTGEAFTGVRELKQILVKSHRRDFYRCLTEKMLTYALGRGLDYYDVFTVDAIVECLEKENGRPSALLNGIVESAPFQKCRATPPARTAAADILRSDR